MDSNRTDDEEHPFVKKGYDGWIELWITYGGTPSATYCPARRLEPGSEERNAYIKGWNRAKREFENSK